MPATRTLTGAPAQGQLSQSAARLACRHRGVAREAGIELSVSYAARITADGLARCDQLAVTTLGDGVVIHTAPAGDGELPIVLGYADRDGEWLRDGSRRQPPGELR